MATSGDELYRIGFGKTSRRDAWWLPQLATFLGLSAFIVYTTWAGLQNAYYWHGGYLSPFYAPELWGSSPHAWFGPQPAWYPSFVPFTPAAFILIFPAGFRFTCYYYRGAYYKAFWADPPGCAVGEPRKTYWGERSFPLVIQNIHRYFLYAAVAFVGLLSYEVYKAMWFDGKFGIGVGTLVLALNVVLIAGYTFGCHSLRHILGGVFDRFSRHPVRKNLYHCSSFLNRNHMKWAWASLVSVMFSDVYVRLVAMGVWTDWRIL